MEVAGQVYSLYELVRVQIEARLSTLAGEVVQFLMGKVEFVQIRDQLSLLCREKRKDSTSLSKAASREHNAAFSALNASTVAFEKAIVKHIAGCIISSLVPEAKALHDSQLEVALRRGELQYKKALIEQEMRDLRATGSVSLVGGKALATPVASSVSRGRGLRRVVEVNSSEDLANDELTKDFGSLSVE